MREESENISVIVPTRNRIKQLRRCLDCLEQQTVGMERFDVVVVDDGSNSKSSDSYKHLTSGDLRLRVLHQQHAGPASARNRGASASRGRLLAFTDDDCMPDPRWLERAVFWLSQNADWVGLEGAVEPLILDDSHPFLGERVVNLDGGVFATANMFYRREPFLDAGGFDPGFRYPLREDTEFASRIGRRGEIGFRRDVVVRHPVSAYLPWGRALRARYLVGDVHMFRVNPSFFEHRGISRESDVFRAALVTIFRNERERETIHDHPSLLPHFLISVGLEKVAVVAVFLGFALSLRR